MVTIGPIDKSSPSTRFYGIAEVISQNVGGNYSTIRLTVQAYNGPSGNTSSQFNATGAMSTSIDSKGISRVKSQNPFLPSGYAANQLRWSESSDFNVTHDANGYLGPLQVRLGLAYGSINENHYADLTIARIPKVPAAPGTPTVGTVTTTSVALSWSAPNNNGATITGYTVSYSVNADFSGASTQASGDTSETISGLTPGTTYYFRVRATNSVGNSAWSGTRTQSTLPAVAPGFSVAPYLSGLGATITFSPPGGVSGVTKYNYEWQLVGTSSPTAGNTLTTTALVEGLTPGSTYEYRANAEIGTYTSPWSSWFQTTQPNPNTNPGDFFSGATTDTTDTDYAWTGTAQNSTSTATNKNVAGWRTFAQGNSVSGGTGTIVQALGGAYGNFSAKVTFNSDATAAGFIAGTDITSAATVSPLSTYYGSLHVRLPLRTQRLEAGVSWYDATDTLISTTWGDDVVVAPSLTTFTRIVAYGVAPSGAVKATVVVRDVTGTSWSLWQGGDVMFLDAAMVSLSQYFPYFSGSFPDTDQYLYTWLGLPHESVSVRYTNTTVYVDPLLDPDCTPVPAPPTPPVIFSDCIDEVGIWRRYLVQVPEEDVELWASTLPTLVLSTGAVAERQVRIRYYPNPDGVAPELVDTTSWDAELILTYIPPSTVLTLDGVTQRVRASVNGASPIIGNQLLYGTGGVPATWPELRCGIGYVITLDVPTDAPSGNLSTQVFVTSRM